MSSKQIMAISGAAKYNLMGHSHGAHSIRYVAAIMPDKVASVTTVDGVNAVRPWPWMMVAGLTNILGPSGTVVVGALVNGLGKIEAYLSGNPSPAADSVAMLNSLTTAMVAYNKEVPAGVPSTCGQRRWRGEWRALLLLGWRLGVDEPAGPA